jgi:hypothetical protein
MSIPPARIGSATISPVTLFGHMAAGPTPVPPFLFLRPTANVQLSVLKPVPFARSTIRPSYYSVPWIISSPTVPLVDSEANPKVA